MNNLQKLLYLGSNVVRFLETFNTTYVPAAFNTLYSNIYNNWSIFCSGGGTIGRFNGSTFYVDSGTNSSGSSVIYRDVEGYSVNRPTEIALKFSTYSGYGGSSETRKSPFEMSIGGDYTKNKVLGNKENNATVNFGGIALSAMHFTWGTGSEVALLVNNSKVAIHSNVLNFNDTYYLFLKIDGLNIYYDWNQTGVKPTTYAHSYTATNLTQLSNKFMIGAAASAGNNATRSVTVDDLNTTLY
jgi:hypothetical protein